MAEKCWNVADSEKAKKFIAENSQNTTKYAKLNTEKLKNVTIKVNSEELPENVDYWKNQKKLDVANTLTDIKWNAKNTKNTTEFVNSKKDMLLFVS